MITRWIEPAAFIADARDAFTVTHNLAPVLNTYNLVSSARAASSVVHVHRLVQAVTRGQLDADGTTNAWVTAAHTLLTAAIPRPPATRRHW